MGKKKILAICGSTRKDSVNLHIIQQIALLYAEQFDWIVFTDLAHLPHFNPDLDNENAPQSVTSFRDHIRAADGVLICTPEYVFSLPGSLKNAIEWTVSTVLFTDKPTALITASSQGVKTHEALEILMRTLGVKAEGTSLLIQAPKTKTSIDGKITDEKTLEDIKRLMMKFAELIG